MSSGRVLAGAGVYLLLYELVALLLRPEPEPGRRLLAHLVFLLPTGLALATTWRAAWGSRGGERVFWGLLAGGALAASTHNLNKILTAAHGLGLAPFAGLPGTGDVSYYAYCLLVIVALLVRPDLPRGRREVREATLEWLMAAVAACFLVLYFAVIPSKDPSHPWFLIYATLEMFPGLCALWLARRVRQPPFRDVYRILAGGFLLGAVAGMLPLWIYGSSPIPVLSPLQVLWVIPFFPMAAAALRPRGPTWVRSEVPSAGTLRRFRIATLSVAFPAVLDLAIRALAWQPQLAYERSQVALVSSALLGLLVALRVRHLSRATQAPEEPGDSPEARMALGEPSEVLQFASGVAHELNNPLMAVAGWAELALRRGALERAPLEALLASARRAAAAVARLQRLAHSEGPPPEGGEGPRP